MLRLHRESSRSYPGRSVQYGDWVMIHKPSGGNAGWGYRLTKSRRQREHIRPVSRHEPKGMSRKACRVVTRERLMRKLVR